ncbi:hypothetical protein [Kosakonia oryziphila]|uniref:Uncharacterized protein n=1 Tax=Kosakonia oryziphila TaxID=1005667 RepID=A0A1C4GKZ3_9ENTR|nr:hypothetical protein [Kosakonia oryziphila]SCC68553.1 hypothetical protein GA0061070_10768 [Kosakonia oryziphila]
MATPSTFPLALLTVPFHYATDFTELADNCERFTEVIVECDDPAHKMALCGRLSACLGLLQSTLQEPVPDAIKASLTVDHFPTRSPVFEAESDQLCRYCQLLTQLLMSGLLASSQQRVMGDLLSTLVGFFADTLKMPRWLRTDDGVVALDVFL